MTNILQAPLLVNFLYPMLLIFLITFAILEKTKIFGDGKQQVNAMIALVVSLIFVAAVFPKIIVANLVQFMSVGLVIIFVGLMLWGFASGGEGADLFKPFQKGIVPWLIGLAMFFGVLWATGVGGAFVGGLQRFFAFLFDSSWSGSFWTNAVFIGVIAGAIAVVLKSGTAKS